MDKFLKPTFTKITSKEDAPNTATFTLEKLERGYGSTIGNPLRRALLSSVPGMSPFAIKVTGNSHEFSAIKDANEDVVELVLNLKELVLKADRNIIGDDEIVELKLTSKSGVVKAKDIEVPTGVEIVNKDLVIANTSKDGAIKMTIYAIFSKGYLTFKETRSRVKEVLGNKAGLIPVDANFSPVVKTNVVVEEVNPGEEVVYERLKLVVETNGSMKPEEAVQYAASALTNYYGAFSELGEVSADIDFIEEVEETEDTQLSVAITSLNLSTRSENALLAAKIDTVDELIDRTVEELAAIPNIGNNSLFEIIEVIKEMGLSFKSE